MEINYFAILACGVVSLVLGFVWYGPLFGKKWMEVIKVTEADIARRKEMQKGMGKLYATTFVLALLQAFGIACLVNLLPTVTPLRIAMMVWLAFVLPVVAGGSMWNNDSAKVSWARFLIQTGYYLVLLVVFSFIIGR